MCEFDGVMAFNCATSAATLSNVGGGAAPRACCAAAIEKKDSVRFAATYKKMLESCYSCHKAVGRPYLRPQIPTAQAQTVINLDPNATWPE